LEGHESNPEAFYDYISPVKLASYFSLLLGPDTISGGRRQNLQQHVRVKQSNPLPNETKSHGLFFAEISVSQVTKLAQISVELNIAFCLIAAAVVAGCV
jgi:hypothetical protein